MLDPKTTTQTPLQSQTQPPVQTGVQMHSSPQVFLGADHGGFALKESLKSWLAEQGYRVTDLGAASLQPEDDYPEYAVAVAEAVRAAESEGSVALGVLFCRSSAGMTIAANKVFGIRAVSLESVAAAEHARAHNNAQVASVSGDWSSIETAQEIITAFLQTPFSEEPRHARRVAQILAYEQSAVTIRP